jgi:HSP20 family protein
MPATPVEVKRSTPASSPTPDVWQSLRSEVDQLFERFSSGFGMPSLRRMFDTSPAYRGATTMTVPSPAMDITEDGNGYRLTAELPGMTEQDIELRVTGDTLTLKGEKKQESEHKEKNCTLSERSYGAVQRGFFLPERIDRDKVDANFTRGVLTVILPKTPTVAAQEKKIEVKAAA